MNDNSDHNNLNDDYLWTGSGEPDPLIANLEKRLRPLRHDASLVNPPAQKPRITSVQFILVNVFLAAAAVLVAIPFLFIDNNSNPNAAGKAYEVTLDEGAARVIQYQNGVPNLEVKLLTKVPHQFPVGSRLVCEDGGRARVRIVGSGDITEVGEATIQGPGRLDLTHSTKELEKLYLHQGSMRAVISASAKARLFQVETPAGTAVDLGCVYTMNVKDDGRTELSVDVGRVAFEIGGKNVYVWSGASCYADKTRGVTTPVDKGTTLAFKSAVESYELKKDGATVEELLNSANLRDAASLWHLLIHAPAGHSEKIYNRLAELSAPPAGVSKETIVKKEPAALEAWRADIMCW
ncbi:MAG: FecR domain-containing protein [Planctomycetota bacterium]